MVVNYTTATQDSPTYKCLITGRADDLTKLLEEISQGRSVVLFGERRIGKTSLLYLIRDLINDISAYQNDLIDNPYLTNIISVLQSRVSGYKAVYLNLQSLPNYNKRSFNNLLYEELQKQNLGDYSIQNHSLTEAIEALNQSCQSRQEKILILIDESELFL